MTSLEAVSLGLATLTDEHSREERAQCSERLRKHYSMGGTGHRGSQPKVGKNLREVWKSSELERPKNV